MSQPSPVVGPIVEPIVEMRRINKSFGAIQALDDVSLRLAPGEILGLVGDNSAGKSTLMKILSGAYQRDTGETLVAGWHGWLLENRPARHAGLGSMALGSLFWITLLIAAAARSSRWRFG